MMPSIDDFRSAIRETEIRLGARIARVEETLYGDGRANEGLVANVNKIGDTVLGQRWRDYALILIIILAFIELALIVLLFIRVY